MMRRLISAIVPSIVLVVLAAAVGPFELGSLGLLLCVASVLLAVAGAFLLRADPEEPDSPETWTWLVALLISGAAATSVFWYRVWLYDSWQISPIPMPLIYTVGFWWPGLLLGSLAWALAGTEVERSLRRYTVTLSVGLAAGVVGGGAYQAWHTVCLKPYDRVPIETAISHITSTVPGSVDWSHRLGTVSLVVYCDWAVEAPPYTVYSCLKHLADGAADLLERQDVNEVTVQARTGSTILFSGDATDATSDAIPGWLADVDRAALKDGGRLDQGSLDEMAFANPPEFVRKENAQVFEQAFTSGLAGNEVVITFRPDAAPTGENVDLYAAAYRAANHTIRETAKYFPDIEQFQVDMAGYTRTVPRNEAAAESFFLQDRMTPQDSVLGLVTKTRASTTAVLDPAMFHPADPLEHNQLAVLITMGKIEQQRAGRLYEEIPLQPGHLYVTEVKPDGTATLFVLPNQGEPAGPIEFQPSAEELAADQWITDLGFLPRAGFPAAPAEKK